MMKFNILLGVVLSLISGHLLAQSRGFAPVQLPDKPKSKNFFSPTPAASASKII
jgi:hypothetical protein